MIAKLRQRFSSTQEPERSLTLRYLILAAMLVPLLALARVAPLWSHVIITAIGISVGHGYSYQKLAKPAGPATRSSQLIRVVMFVAIHVALLWMCVGLSIGATVPQAQFAIFAQAITSFDLRYRTSLFNTLIHSLANFYIAASLSRTSELAIYLIIFAGLVLVAFFVAEKEDGTKSARLWPRPNQPTGSARKLLPPQSRSLIVFGFGFGAAALLAILVVFLFTPRFASRPLVPPFSIQVPLSGGVKSEIINPGVPLVQINGWSNGTSDYFYGFDTDLDLRYRGGLSDEVVMYVRSPSRSYWRSHSYDFYTGAGWSQSDKTLRRLRRAGRLYSEISPPLGSPLPVDKTGPGLAQIDNREVQQIVQSFTIAKDQPNLIFAAYRPAEIFIIAEQISVDSGDGLRLSEPLKAGLTYSVVSYRPEFDPALLRQASGRYPPQIVRRYLQLPDNISERVRDLAQTLTAPYDNPYDKIMALNQHLLAEYPYNFFPPPHPPGAEVVDTFLFQDREGICEQYVTALVVMARTLGIPARLAAGYGSGDYNALTGYYEVRLNHAHSWAEVYFPEYGWVPFDPTPGWLPQPYPTPVQTWFFSNNSRLFGFDIPVAGLIPGSLAGLARAAPVISRVMILAGLMILAFWLSKRLRGILTRRLARRYSQRPARQTRQAILALYQRGAGFLTRRKYRPRQKEETLSEYAQSLGHLPALLRLTQAAEIAAYRPEAPEAETVAEAEAALARLKDELS